MSWISTLCETYDNNVGLDSGDKAMPVISHMSRKAQVEMIIDSEGNFREAETIIDKDNCYTNIPVTEESGGRTSNLYPHPLCDYLSYIAGDYSKYEKSDTVYKNPKNKPENKFNQYITRLKQWSESEYSHPKVKAIYAYLSKRQVISDLVKAGVVQLDDNGMFSNKKIAGKTYDKALVRFRVHSMEDTQEACWKDSSLHKAFQDYYINSKEWDYDKCYVTGEEQIISKNYHHPTNIVSSPNGAKLISSKDDGLIFKYRGRFLNSSEACTISYESTQKAHNALSWLVRVQGCYVGNDSKRWYVCWCPNGKRVVNPVDRRWDSYEVNEGTKCEYKQEIEKIFNGEKANFSETDKAVLIVLDPPSDGRLSITYYKEILASDFLDRMKNWSETCCWIFNWYGKNVITTPQTKDIIKYAFGEETEGNGKNNEKKYTMSIGDKLFKEQLQRIVCCMVDKQPVPRDIVRALFLKASDPMKYNKKGNNYENTLSTACAVAAKYYNDLKKDVYVKMTLDENNKDINYLFGRLLAVADYVEYITYEKDEKSTRNTNAEKLQSSFVYYPLRTWKILRDKINPYMNKKPGLRVLSRGKMVLVEDLIADISSLMETMDRNILNRPLNELYLFGYYHQRQRLFTPIKTTEKTEEEN